MTKLTNYAQLLAHYKENEHFQIISHASPIAKLLCMAIHGGAIEPGTKEFVWQLHNIIPQTSLYVFDSALPWAPNQYGNDSHHITSTKFDEPTALAMAQAHEVIVSVHGCEGHKPAILLGGLDENLKINLAHIFENNGLCVERDNHKYPGKSVNNICNKSITGQGVQLELTQALRQNSELLKKAALLTAKILRQDLRLQ